MYLWLKKFFTGLPPAKSISACLLLIIVFLNPDNAVAGGKDSIERAGDEIQLIIPASAYAATFVMKDAEGRKQFYKSCFWDIAVTQALKYAINKPRPRGHGNYSFPSGHTSISFQGASFIHERYGWKYAVPFYAGAVFVGYSRLHCHKHDLVDVLGGAFVGIASNKLFTKPYKGFKITPVAKKGFLGFMFIKKW